MCGLFRYSVGSLTWEPHRCACAVYAVTPVTHGWPVAQRLSASRGEGRAIAAACQPNALAESAWRTAGAFTQQQRQACRNQDARNLGSHTERVTPSRSWHFVRIVLISWDPLALPLRSVRVISCCIALCGHMHFITMPCRGFVNGLHSLRLNQRWTAMELTPQQSCAGPPADRCLCRPRHRQP